MAQRPNPRVFLLGLAIGIGGALYFRMAPPAFEPPDSSAPAPAVVPETPTPAPRVPAYDPSDPEARESAIRATRLPTELRHPIEPQYRDAPRSDVPHELIAAYDESPGTTRGKRRMFILGVAPNTDRQALDRLVEHLRTQHLDASALRIRIYDSKVAATHPAQAGVSKDPHLVASYSRDDTGTTYELQGIPAPLDYQATARERPP